MKCKSCGFENFGQFTAEMAIHFPGLKNINKPHVWVFPELLICLDCGFTEFKIAKDELHQLEEGRAVSAW